MADDQAEQEQAEKESTLAKITGAVAALAAAWVVQKALGIVWQRVTGHKPPAASEGQDVNFSEVAAAAAITGGLVALARVLATHGTARFATRVNRSRPPLPKA